VNFYYSEFRTAVLFLLWFLKHFQVTAINPSVIVYAGDHDKYVPSTTSSFLSTPRSSSKVVFSSVDGARLPCLLLKMEYLDSQAVQPMYPRRLVKVVSNLQSPSHALMQLCQVNSISNYVLLSWPLFQQESLRRSNSYFQIAFLVIMTVYCAIRALNDLTSFNST
jgi:hypothetical protein